MNHKRFWLSLVTAFLIAAFLAIALPCIADSFDPVPNDPPRRTGGSGTR